MAVWLRLVILCFCVASILAAAQKGLAADAISDPDPAPSTEAPSTEAPSTPPPAPACNEGERQGDATDCHKFTECKAGSWKPDRCFWFRKFDSVTKKCVMWGAECTK